jgi:methylglutaconyl-CoA hydratase
MNELVTTAIAEGVATLTLNRPEKANALSTELIAALGAAVSVVAAKCDLVSGTVRAVILAGAGRNFCAGMDLRAVIHDPQAMGDMLRNLSKVGLALRRLPVPTISRVQGAAVGGGCGLMVVTDFAVTHAECRLGYPEVDLGVCPAVVAPWLMKKIGAGRARAMLLAGGTITGAQGFELGLATHLCAAESLESTTTELAARLAKGGPQAIAATKHWLNELDGSNDEAVHTKAAEISAQIIGGAEAQERLRRAFGV